MPIRPLAELTWEEARDAQKPGWIAVLPAGAVEAHGPHLPLRTDGLIAEAMAAAGVAAMEARGLRALILPTLDYAPAPFAADFPGTLSISPETVTLLVLDLVRATSKQGARALVIANAHLDPAHVGALRASVDEAAAEGLAVIFPDVTRREWAARLTEEFRSGACHAGQYESSIVMAAAPELVRDDVRRGLAPNPSSLSVAIRDGLATFEQAGGPRAYFGYPAQASAEEGAATTRILGDILAEAVMESLGVKEDRP